MRRTGERPSVPRFLPRQESSFPKEQPADVINNVGNSFSERRENRSDLSSVTEQPSVFEIYHRGGSQIHVHFTWSLKHSGKIKADNFCAVFQGFPVRSRQIVLEGFTSGNLNLEACGTEFPGNN